MLDDITIEHEFSGVYGPTIYWLNNIEEKIGDKELGKKILKKFNKYGKYIISNNGYMYSFFYNKYKGKIYKSFAKKNPDESFMSPFVNYKDL